jgi:arylformamidase
MIYDISPPISERLAVWPGDTAFRREVLLYHERGDSSALSTIHGTAHLGAHADAFSHVVAGGATIDEMDLERYVGPCQVVRVDVGRGDTVTPAHLNVEIAAPRVLLATGTYPDSERFNEDFAALSVELVDMLHAAGVVLVGVDTPSVDLFSSVEYECHRRLIGHGIAILEGLRLNAVEAGLYELIALPLRIVGGDGSPVRAVLRTLGD